MVTSVFQGIVPIKLFNHPLSRPAAFADFDVHSDTPAFGNSPLNANAGDVGAFQQIIAGVDGESILEVNPTGGHNRQTQSNIDGTTCFIGTAALGNPGFYYKAQSQVAGVYTAAPWSWLTIPTPIFGFLNTTYWPLQSLNFKSNDAATPTPVIGSFWSSTNNPGNQHVNRYLDIGAVDFPHFYPLNDPNTGINYWQSAVWVNCRIPGLGTTFDNCTYITGITGGGSPLNHIFLWNSATGVSIYEEIHLDNTFLDLLFNNPLLINNGAQGFRNGFIIVINTGGAGPTGQNYETVVFNQDMSRYSLISWEAMDAESTAQIANDRPQVQIDPDGIFWYNGFAFVDAISYSFSLGFNFPVYYFGNLNPIVLPCYIDTMPGVTYPQS